VLVGSPTLARVSISSVAYLAVSSARALAAYVCMRLSYASFHRFFSDFSTFTSRLFSYDRYVPCNLVIILYSPRLVHHQRKPLAKDPPPQIPTQSHALSPLNNRATRIRSLFSFLFIPPKFPGHLRQKLPRKQCAPSGVHPRSISLVRKEVARAPVLEKTRRLGSQECRHFTVLFFPCLERMIPFMTPIISIGSMGKYL
jgi:hypothetical protein